MRTLTDNQIAESRQVFSLCDVNGDGYIDRGKRPVSTH